MDKKVTYPYDEAADVLYVSFFPGEIATTAVELDDNISLQFNRAEKRWITLKFPIRITNEEYTVPIFFYT